MKPETITPAIKAKIEALTYERDGITYISLGNYALDFKKEYRYLGCTAKTVRLSWQNGRDFIPAQAWVEDRGQYFALHTDGWRFIEHLEKVDA